jgi:uncharacterized protein (DUF4415 family)
MTAKSANTPSAWIDPDEAPDLSGPEWVAHIEQHGVLSRGGRPLSAKRKVSQTLRLDPEVVAFYRASGPGWQTRMNDALRRAAGLA